MAIQSKKNRDTMLSLWDRIHIHKQFGEIFICKEVLESWERSKKYNVDKLKKSNQFILSDEDLEKLLYTKRDFIKVVSSAMEDIHSITKSSGFCITLVDIDGFCLKIIGDPETVDFVRQCNLIEGSNWSEKCMGTNSHSLGVFLKKPVHVFGYEHYCKCASLASCCSAPIRDANNNILGTLNLSGPYELVNPHTLGMVYAATRAVERELQLEHLYKDTKKLYHEVSLANIHKQAILKSISEGLITIDKDSIITLINEYASKLLNIDNKKFIGQDISTLFDSNQNAYFINSITSNRSFSEEPIIISINNKSSKYIISSSPMDNNNQGGTIITFREFNQVAKRFVRIKPNTTFDCLIGKNPLFVDAVEEAKIVAATDSNVLLLGESGVGKDLFAQAIHNASVRRNEAFIAINCAAIPRELITTELFGYEEGAFTGARKRGNPGKFELAEQGTLFLDEIGEMPIDLQTTLLRVLEEKTITRLGGKEPIPINIRLISATNKNLLQEIELNQFRQDLFFRIQVISINIPALRERKDDIPLLVEYFINKISSRLGKKIKRINPDAMNLLLKHNWPGNIRELRNAIERSIHLTKSSEIHVDSLPSHIRENPLNTITKWKRTNSQEVLEKKLIKQYLAEFKYNKTQVAEALNISRSSLYRKMTKYNIK